MEVTELVWRLFLILLPGVISTLILRQISPSKNMSVFNFTIYSATLGIGIWVIMELICSIFQIGYCFGSNKKVCWGLNLTIWDCLFDTKKGINKIEVFISYLSSIPLGIILGYLITRKLISRLFQKLKLTQRYGDDDVWSFFLNAPKTEWVLIRDKKSNLSYFGRLNAYSDSSEKREILIEEVTVYTTDNFEQLYESEAVYLELNSFDFSIEIPKFASD